ncbi:MAG: DUF6434 domain-containing protein [Verrucomicrobiota bacterium]
MRPQLTAQISSDEFEEWYWKKEELVDFCQSASIPSSGSKPELELRIKAFLRGLPLPKSPKRRIRKKVQDELDLSTVIEEGWSCNPKLSAFFKQHCGNAFRFNYAMRNFIHTQAGRTLEEAIECYKESLQKEQPSLPQNQFAAFMKSYSRLNPQSSRNDIILAWEKWKQTRRSKKS